MSHIVPKKLNLITPVMISDPKETEDVKDIRNAQQQESDVGSILQEMEKLNTQKHESKE